MSRALVVFSGGQDSTTCLFWAKQKFTHVEAITFDYGQRHRIELESADRICRETNTPQKVLRLSELSELGGNALMDSNTELKRDGGFQNLPNSFVPGRNILFLTLAAAWATQRGITDLVGGMCEADYSGYPDCRQNFIDSMQSALSLGIGQDFRIHTPLMKLDKAAVFQLADELGALEIILRESATCYQGDRTQFHAWGYGCGICPACLLRSQGFARYQNQKFAAVERSV